MFTWLQSFRPVKLQCSFPSLWNMEETSEELLNFSIGIDLLGPDPTGNKKKSWKKLASCTFRKFFGSVVKTSFWIFKTLDNFGSLTFKTFFSDTSSSGFDFLHFSHKFWAFHSQLSVNWITCSRWNQNNKCGVFLTSPIGTFVYFFLGVVRILNKRLLRADPCCRSVINEFAHAFSCAYIEYNGCTWEAWRALRKLELIPATPRATPTHFSCSPNFPRAFITRYTHAKHEQILNFPRQQLK